METEKSRAEERWGVRGEGKTISGIPCRSRKASNGETGETIRFARGWDTRERFTDRFAGKRTTLRILDQLAAPWYVAKCFGTMQATGCSAFRDRLARQCAAI